MLPRSLPRNLALRSQLFKSLRLLSRGKDDGVSDDNVPLVSRDFKKNSDVKKRPTLKGITYDPLLTGFSERKVLSQLQSAAKERTSCDKIARKRSDLYLLKLSQFA